MVNVPAEAVQAAHAAICEQNLDDCLDPDWRGKCVKALEAAAPHMLEHFANRIDWRCQDCEDQIAPDAALKKLREAAP